MATPDWKPLCLKYIWQGSYEYHARPGGHSWYYNARNKWLINSGDETKNKFIKLASRAKSIIPSLCTLFQHDLKNENDFVKWLLGTNGKLCPVGGHVSMLLNAVTRASQNRLFYPFEIISTFADGNLTCEIRGLKEGASCWFYMAGVNFLSFYENVALLSPKEFIQTASGKATFTNDPFSLKGQDEEPTDNPTQARFAGLRINRLRFCRFLHRYHVLDFIPDHGAGKVKITLRDDMEIHEYVKGRICGCIPIPGSIRQRGSKGWEAEPGGVNSPEVVVASPAVRDALGNLSRIWQDHFAKSVLISAPPGSGKEHYARSIPFGSGRKGENMQTLSLAGSDQAEIQKRLFGYVRSDGSVCHGLISATKDSALFLDEVHQPGPEKEHAGTRAALLRPLENGEFFISGSDTVSKVDNVLFVMATSRDLSELDIYEPPDFWTRVTHTIQVRHPFYLDQCRHGYSEDLLHVVACFFAFFWWDCVSQHFGIPLSLARSKPLLAPNEIEAVRFQQMRSMLRVLARKRKSEETLSEKFAHLFIQHCERVDTEVHNFSIRGVRSLVTRLFSIAAFAVSKGESDLFKSAGEFENVLRIAFDEIYRVAKIK